MFTVLRINKITTGVVLISLSSRLQIHSAVALSNAFILLIRKSLTFYRSLLQTR